MTMELKYLKNNNLFYRMKKNKLPLQITTVLVFIISLVYLILTDSLNFIAPNLKMIFRVLLSFVIAVIFYFIFYYLFLNLIPTLNVKRRLKIQKPEDALDSLINDFKTAKRKKQMGRAVRLSFQIKHLYEYLDDKDKKRLKGKMKEVFNYTGGENEWFWN